MKKVLNICVHANQNEVTRKEGEKIRRKVKLFFPDYRLRLHLNVSRAFAEKLEGDKITFFTSDINYIVSASIVEFIEVTNIGCYELYCNHTSIKLN
jgi:hypothetical protein